MVSVAVFLPPRCCLLRYPNYDIGGKFGEDCFVSQDSFTG